MWEQFADIFEKLLLTCIVSTKWNSERLFHLFAHVCFEETLPVCLWLHGDLDVDGGLEIVPGSILCYGKGW